MRQQIRVFNCTESVKLKGVNMIFYQNKIIWRERERERVTEIGTRENYLRGFRRLCIFGSFLFYFIPAKAKTKKGKEIPKTTKMLNFCNYFFSIFNSERETIKM